MTSQRSKQTRDREEIRSGINKRVIQVFLQVLIQAVVLFASAGTLRWWEAWAFIGIYLAGIAGNAYFMLRLQPETVAERGHGATAADVKKWDKIVGVVALLFYFIGIHLVAGLDLRFAWPGRFSLPVEIAGFAVWVVGSVLFGWAMYSNAYFSTVVRIQDDRGHQVCDTGPYRFVRHPGYVGAALQSLGTALLLGSPWALIPALLAVLSFALRTALEDRTLQDELAGYSDYAQRVRYRLLPGIW